MRLRPLTEAECYARCYGGRHDESVTVVSDEPDAERLSHAGATAPDPNAGVDQTVAREAA